MDHTRNAHTLSQHSHIQHTLSHTHAYNSAVGRMWGTCTAEEEGTRACGGDRRFAIYIYLRVCVCVCGCVCVCACARGARTLSHTHVYECMHAYACYMHLHMHMRTSTYMHMRIATKVFDLDRRPISGNNISINKHLYMLYKYILYSYVHVCVFLALTIGRQTSNLV